MLKKLMVAALLAAWMPSAQAADVVAVTDVVARQRYPVDGLVDITCKVAGIEVSSRDFKFAVSAVMPDTGCARDVSHFWVVRDGTNSADHGVHSDGDYQLLWDASADLGRRFYSNMVVRVTVVDCIDKVQLWEGGPYWATTNVGAENPEDCGYYFWWGDTVGYKWKNDVWVASDGSSSNFKFYYDPESLLTYRKSIGTLQDEGWITADNVLTLEHDAAQKHWGGAWRMPTDQELRDLGGKCDWSFSTTNGVNGYVIRGRGAYAGVSIFIPFAGYGSYYDYSLRESGTVGYYWSSAPCSDDLSAWYLYICEDYHATFDHQYRYYGQPIRPVQKDVVGGYSNPFELGIVAGVTDVVAKQRYPWNGLVDITCKVAGIVGTTNGLEFTVAVVMPDTGNTRSVAHFQVMRDGTNSSARGVYADGDYRLLWDARADLGTVRYTNMVVRVNLIEKVQLWEGGPYWATTNIGAEKPEDYGYYFWWGDTVGYKREGDTWVATDGSPSDSSFINAIRHQTSGKSIATLRGDGWVNSKGGDYVLAPEHDAAQVQWGGFWRIPTYQELDDLNNKCDWTWISQNGVNGYIVSGRGTYASNSIFLPCAGCGDYTSLVDVGSYGYYWSSVPYADEYNVNYHAWGFRFSSFFLHVADHIMRNYWLPIRPVQGDAK